MTPLDRAIHAITQVLDSQRIEYAIVGGIANAVWRALRRSGWTRSNERTD